jgi:hypothetical protein
MPKGHPTSLFVSSTCYDLSQVRADLADFAKTMGFEPVLSELDSFPVDPSSDTVSNCLEVVRTRADLFLLVVGGRYGSIADTGKSVTNLEFLEATAKGIPRYVFVKRNIMDLLPTWRANPDADFAATVDTPKLFEFVLNLRGSGNLWVFPFDTAQDITQTLRKQLSYLLADCLEIRSHLTDRNRDILALGPQTLRIYIEKPKAWELKAFARAIPECMMRHRAKKLDYELGLNLGEPIKLEDRMEARDWILRKVGQITHIIDNLSKAFNRGLLIAVGEPGKPGDIARIWHLAERIADAYSALLHWALEFDCVNADEEFWKALMLARHIASDPISQIETFANRLYDDIVEALQKPESDRTITLSLTVSNKTELMSEMEKLSCDDA